MAFPDPARVPGLQRDLTLEALKRGCTTTLAFDGESMAPLLAPGDRIAVCPLRPGFRAGDVVVFQSAGRFVAHRVIARFRRRGVAFVATRGDAVSDRPPEIFPETALLGLVAARVRMGRRHSLESGFLRFLGVLVAWSGGWAVPLARLAPRSWRRALRVALNILGERGTASMG